MTAGSTLQFSDAYFFGDSLTDGGAFYGHNYNANPMLLGALQQVSPTATYYSALNASFTSPGGKTWATYLTATLAGKALQANNPLNPANAPATGTNYAQGGAQVNTTPGVGGQPIGVQYSPALAALSVKQQVDVFLQQKSGSADPGAVYAVYGGANDVFYLANFLKAAQSTPAAVPSLIAMTSGPTKALFQQIASGALAPTNGATAVLAQSAADLRDQVARLKAAGAKTVIVPTLPDMGKTPYGLSDALVGKTLSDLSNGYNALLQKTLGEANLNVIIIDTSTLTNDMQANPAKYGLSNSTGIACSGLGMASSLLCTTQVANGDTYMFADGVHPTDATHRMIAGYVASVTDMMTNTAPILAQAMQQLPVSNGRHIASIIENHTRSLDGTRRNGGDFRVYLDLSTNPSDQEGNASRPGFEADTSRSNLTLGVDMLTSASGFAGLALGKYEYGSKLAGDNTRLTATETSFSVYGKTFAGPVYASLLAGLSEINFERIDSRLGSGAVAADKHASTHANRTTIRLATGLPIPLGRLTVTPKFDVLHQSLHISSFADDGTASLRTVFEQQEARSTVGSAALELEASIQAGGVALRPYLAGSYHREYEDDPRSVSFRVGNTLNAYRADLPVADTRYASIAAGINFDLGKMTTIGINYAKTLSQEAVDSRQYGMSLSGRF